MRCARGAGSTTRSAQPGAVRARTGGAAVDSASAQVFERLRRAGELRLWRGTRARGARRDFAGAVQIVPHRGDGVERVGLRRVRGDASLLQRTEIVRGTDSRLSARAAAAVSRRWGRRAAPRPRAQSAPPRPAALRPLAVTRRQSSSAAATVSAVARRRAHPPLSANRAPAPQRLVLARRLVTASGREASHEQHCTRGEAAPKRLISPWKRINVSQQTFTQHRRGIELPSRNPSSVRHPSAPDPSARARRRTNQST